MTICRSVGSISRDGGDRFVGKRSFNSVCNSRSKEEKIVVDGAKKLRIEGGKTQSPLNIFY
jgi:hypothetical protein